MIMILDKGKQSIKKKSRMLPFPENDHPTNNLSELNFHKPI